MYAMLHHSSSPAADVGGLCMHNSLYVGGKEFESLVGVGV